VKKEKVKKSQKRVDWNLSMPAPRSRVKRKKIKKKKAREWVKPPITAGRRVSWKSSPQF